MKKLALLAGLISMFSQNMGVEFEYMYMTEEAARTMFGFNATDSYDETKLETKQLELFKDKKKPSTEIHKAYRILRGIIFPLDKALKKFSITDLSKETPKSLKEKWVKQDTVTTSVEESPSSLTARNQDRLNLNFAYIRLLYELEKTMGIEFKGVPEGEARHIFGLKKDDKYTQTQLDNKNKDLPDEASTNYAYILLSGLILDLNSALTEYGLTDLTNETPESLKKKWLDKITSIFGVPDKELKLDIAYVRLLYELENIKEGKKKGTTTTTTPTDPLGKALATLTDALNNLTKALSGK